MKAYEVKNIFLTSSIITFGGHIMPKRKNSSIKEYTLKSGEKRYEFVISLGENSNGKRIQAHRRGFKSYAEAEAVFNKLSQTKPDNFVKQKQIKVAELRDLWFENYKQQVKESTANKNKQIFDNHVIPSFGNQYIDKITVAELQKWADQKAKQIVKYRDAINEFNAIFEYGIRLNYVQENPLKRIIIPKKTSRPRRDTEHNVYTRDELNHFLQAAKEYGLVPYTYFKLLSSTGLRKSEALALTWKDINLDDGTISINKTLAYGLGGKTIIQSPKSPKSKRIVPISDSLNVALLDYKQKQKVISNKLFHNLKGKYLSMTRPPQWLIEIYSKNQELKKITVHGFRHTFATLLIAETDIKPKTVQMLLGHENIQMTLDIYTHINKKNTDDAINALKQLNI